MSALTPEQRDLVEKVKQSTSIVSVLSRQLELRRSGSLYEASCPFHSERTPSLKVYADSDDPHYHCYGCSAHGDVIDFVKEIEHLSFWQAVEKLAGEAGISIPPSVKGVTQLHRNAGLTVEELARVKKLDIAFLNSLGVRNAKHNNAPAVVIPHPNERSEVASRLYRVSLTQEPRFLWGSGNKAILYGLNRIAGARKHGWAVFFEGASDCWVAWHQDLPAFGIPGKGNWRSKWAGKFRDIPRLYIWQEPGAEELVRKLAHDFPDIRVIVAPEGIKDLSEAHIMGLDLVELLNGLRAQAVPASELVREEHDATLAELEKRAAPVLSAPDPVELVKEAIRHTGYGGDTSAVEITYLAATSRLLKMRQGAMPVHTLLIGPASSGKTFALGTVNSLLPPDAYHKIDAASPRVLIYDQMDLQHKVIEFSEADSLPASEDNPAASAVRSLLQDHFLHYKVTVRDPESGQFTVKEIEKTGPTVLITTSTRKLGDQLGSRLFELEVPDDQKQIQAALMAQANIELHGSAAPSDSLIAFQGLLQAKAPWDVLVPFADKLAEAISKSPAAPRIMRDFARILSLIKSVCLLRHRHRSKDDKGRLVALVEDYRTVYVLVGDMYTGSVTGASKKLRSVVSAVADLRDAGAEGVSVTDVAKHLGMNKMTASRHVGNAFKGGWLVDKLEGKHKNLKDLDLGESLPPADGLPSPDALDYADPVTEGCNSVTPFTVTATVSISEPEQYSHNGKQEGERKTTPAHSKVDPAPTVHSTGDSLGSYEVKPGEWDHKATVSGGIPPLQRILAQSGKPISEDRK